MPTSSFARRFAVLTLIAVSFSLSARADEATHRAKAKEMMTLLHTQRMVQQITDNIKQQISQAADKIAGPSPSDDTKAKVTQFEKQADQLIDSKLGWDAMETGFVDVYMKNFTEEQLDSIIAFYKTPAGQALQQNLPTVNSQVGQIGNSRMGELQPQLKQLFEDFQKNAATPTTAPTTASPSLATPPASAMRPPNTPK